MTTSTQRVAAHRARREAQGLKRVEVWVPEDKIEGFQEVVRAFCSKNKIVTIRPNHVLQIKGDPK